MFIYDFDMGQAMSANYDYYRIFYYAAKCGSITGAAEMLLSSQPNVTRAVKNLERELGCPLFLRSSRGVILTPQGEVLFRRVSAAFELLETGEREIKRSLEHGTMSIGTTEISLNCFLLTKLQEYRRLYPGIRIKITNQTSAQAVDDVKNGLTDFALVTSPDAAPNSLDIRSVSAVKEVAVCSTAFSALKGRTVDVCELVNYPLISLGKPSRSYFRHCEFFASCGLEFKADIEASTTDQIMPMVRADLGIGFVPEKMIDDRTRVFKIKLNRTLPECDICFVKRSGEQLSAAAKELENMILRK